MQQQHARERAVKKITLELMPTVFNSNLFCVFFLLLCSIKRALQHERSASEFTLTNSKAVISKLIAIAHINIINLENNNNNNEQSAKKKDHTKQN